MIRLITVAVALAFVGCVPGPGLSDARVSGRVVVNGTPAVGEVLLLGDFSGVTNAQGGYVVNLPHGWSGTMTLERFGASIVYPPVTGPVADQNWIIEVQYANISGTVLDGTDPQSPVPIEGVTMQARGVTPDGVAYERDVQTATDGTYSLPVPIGVSITIENYQPPAAPALPTNRRA